MAKSQTTTFFLMLAALTGCTTTDSRGQLAGGQGVSQFMLGNAKNLGEAKFNLPTSLTMDPVGPGNENSFRSFSSTRGTTIDIYLEPREASMSCAADKCTALRHQLTNRYTLIELRYQPGIMTLNKMQSRTDLVINPCSRDKPCSLRFVIKYLTSDQRDDIVQVIKTSFEFQQPSSI